MRKISKDLKIKALERIVRAIFGRQDGTIEYRGYIEDCIEVIIECDVDDAVKNLGSLSMADIDYWFYTGEREIDKKDWFTKKKYEGYTEICLTLFPIYWKEVDKLKEEIKKLKEQRKNSVVIFKESK